MARQSQSFDADEALLAGLLLDIGTLPLLEKATRYVELIKDESAMNTLLNKYSANLGATVLRHWKMPAYFQDVTRNRENWHYIHQGKSDLVDLILLARLHSYVGTPMMKALPRINEIPAFFKLDLGELTPHQSYHFIEEASETIKETQRSLAG